MSDLLSSSANYPAGTRAPLSRAIYPTELTLLPLFRVARINFNLSLSLSLSLPCYFYSPTHFYPSLANHPSPPSPSGAEDTARHTDVGYFLFSNDVTVFLYLVKLETVKRLWNRDALRTVVFTEIFRGSCTFLLENRECCNERYNSRISRATDLRQRRGRGNFRLCHYFISFITRTSWTCSDLLREQVVKVELAFGNLVLILTNTEDYTSLCE